MKNIFTIIFVFLTSLIYSQSDPSNPAAPDQNRFAHNLTVEKSFILNKGKFKGKALEIGGTNIHRYLIPSSKAVYDFLMDSIGNASDGNGLYDGSDTIPVATLATVTESGGSTMDFGLGIFPNWPDFDEDGTEYGLYYGKNYYGELGLIYGNGKVYVSDGQANMSSLNSALTISDGGYSQYNNFVDYNNDPIEARTEVTDQYYQTWMGQFNRLAKIRLTNIIADSTIVFSINHTDFFGQERRVLAINLKDTLSNNISLYGYKYKLPNATPSSTNTAKSSMTWTGNTTTTVPSFTRQNYAQATGTTDGSGDLTITHNLPDATFSVTVTPNGTVPYICTVHTKGATTFKVRFFDAAGAAVTATAVDINWIAFDN